MQDAAQSPSYITIWMSLSLLLQSHSVLQEENEEAKKKNEGENEEEMKREMKK